MTRRQAMNQRRFKRAIFVVSMAVIAAACGKATLTRSPEEVEELPFTDVPRDTTDTAPRAVTKAGIIKPVRTPLYEGVTYYLEGEDGSFSTLLSSSSVALEDYEDQMVEVTGTERVIPDETTTVFDVTQLSSVSDHITGDAIAVVQEKIDASYGFTDTDAYTLVASSASAGTAVVEVNHDGVLYHVKLVKKPDPILGEWDIYDVQEGAYKKESDTDAPGETGSTPEDLTAPEDDDTVADQKPLTSDGVITEGVPLKEGYATYADSFAAFTVQYPEKWFYWVVGEAQTAESKPVSSRVLFGDKEVEYSNALIGLDIAPYSFEETLSSYYPDYLNTTQITVRGRAATERTYATGHIRVFVPREKGTTFIISALPVDDRLRSDVLESMLATLELKLP